MAPLVSGATQEDGRRRPRHSGSVRSRPWLRSAGSASADGVPDRAAVEWYVSSLVELPDDPTDADLRHDRFRWATEGRLEVYLSAFSYVNPDAHVVFVGVTPGAAQLRRAATEARRVRRAGGSFDAALHAAVRSARFAGTMRTTLVRWLDELGLHHHLGLSGSAELFTTHDHLLHATSAVRHPVFRDGKNYSGHGPAITRSPLLLRFVDHILGRELEAVPDALVLPLGAGADGALQWLAAQGRVDRRRCVNGLPHPSGANAHGAGQFRQRRGHLRDQIDRWFT